MCCFIFMPQSITKMIFSIVILLLISVTASQETVEPNSPRTQTPTDMTSGDTSETLTTTQQTIIQQTTTDVTNNTQTTSSQSTWMPRKSLLTTSESAITTVNSTETFSEKSNNTAAQGDREGQDVAVNPGLIAVLCIFCIVMAVVVVIVIVKAVRCRRPHFERLDDVSMGKMSEDTPFAHYPPK
ncbi:uncharacterized protein LOC130100846 isoform X2 [Rhinichthys klamathensis goyatoka]|uniref:uncharacterized protein LOC130100846 isoform X2 n=1 Tax=Rhinichthys klamathensis goyatoka TaxID=3034132 RepID=UPI0024B49F23|nr:uncharacterized protein LOC130100846 isoform X2 [Rhinichthys klamathensis goyatoka]